jgi:hypothetical protein
MALWLAGLVLWQEVLAWGGYEHCSIDMLYS